MRALKMGRICQARMLYMLPASAVPETLTFNPQNQTGPLPRPVACNSMLVVSFESLNMSSAQVDQRGPVLKEVAGLQSQFHQQCWPLPSLTHFAAARALRATTLANLSLNTHVIEHER